MSEDDKIKLPERKYYSINDAADKLECSVNDLLHYASIGIIDLCIYLDLKCDVDAKIIHLNIPPQKISEIDDDFHRLDGDKWSIGDLKFLISEGSNDISGYYSGRLFGFFYVPSTEALRAEFSQEEVRISFISTNPEYYDGEDIEINLLKDGGEIFDKKCFCLMASELDKLNSIGSGDFPKKKGSSDHYPAGNENKKNKLIKALIEITYGKGASENIYNLMREGSKEKSPGDMIMDFETRGFKLPAGYKTVQSWIDNVEI